MIGYVLNDLDLVLEYYTLSDVDRQAIETAVSLLSTVTEEDDE